MPRTGSNEVMQMRWARVIQLTMVVSLMTAGAVSAQPASYVVGPGDVLQVSIYAAGEKQDEFSDKVSSAGTIMCPMVGEFRVGGMAVSAIAAEMRVALARDYYVDPQVLVGVKEYAGRVFVLGEVKQPGIYPLREGLTVLSACVLAGGFTDFAAPRRAKVTRFGDGKAFVIELDLGQVKQGKRPDFPLQTGDRIEVPRRLF